MTVVTALLLIFVGIPVGLWLIGFILECISVLPQWFPAPEPESPDESRSIY